VFEGGHAVHATVEPGEGVAAGDHGAVTAAGSGGAAVAAHGSAAAASSQGIAAAEHGETGAHSAAETRTEWLLMFCSLGIAILGLGLSHWIYSRRVDIADRLRGLAGGSVYRVISHKYYVDELYDTTLIKPGHALSDRVLWGWIDKGLIDGLLVNGSAWMVTFTGGFLRLIQNGMLRFYAYAFAVGVAAFVLYLTFSG
jgi:NADH-quinone oxidoreductase subunit L